MLSPSSLELGHPSHRLALGVTSVGALFAVGGAVAGAAVAVLTGAPAVPGDAKVAKLQPAHQ